LEPGIDLLLDSVGYEKLLEKTDLMITGEGKLDEQSLHGKVPADATKVALSAGVPCVALCAAHWEKKRPVQRKASSSHVALPPCLEASRNHAL
jgi:glycerate kinase